MSTFKAPLTKTDLAEIQERNPRILGNQASDDLYAALWEIKRLRAIVLRADQLQAALGEPAGGVGLILSSLRTELAKEPCVREQARLPQLGRQEPPA